MVTTKDQVANAHFNDDSLEPLSEVKKSYQKFSLNKKEYCQYIGKDAVVCQFSGGIPVLADEIKREVYVDSQDSHTLVIGATGSKKTRLVVMPTVRLLGWAGESMVISDPKAEIYSRTAEELEQSGYQIMVLNFRNPALGNAWNPLSIPYQFYQAGDIDRTCEMVNDIAKNLLAADDANKDPFWQNSAADMFFGLVLILFKMCKDNQLSDMTVNISNVLKLRRQLFDRQNPASSSIWHYIKENEIIAPALSGIVLTAKDTRAGILSTFDQKVRYFVYQPNLMDMLANDSNVLERIAENKAAVFLIMPDEKTTYHPLISLFIKQSYEYLIYKAQSAEYGQMKFRLNYMLDEFSSLPTIKDFPSMITAARSRNIRFCLIIQSKHQLKQRYGDEAETILSNCTNWIFLTSREVPLLEEISTLCGRKQEGRMPLISVFTLQHLDKDKGQALMLCGRKRPYYAQLLDIDAYDQNIYGIRKLDFDDMRSQRLEIDGNIIARRFVKEAEKGDGFLDVEKTEVLDIKDGMESLKGCEMVVSEIAEDFLSGIHTQLQEINDGLEWCKENEKGLEAYRNGDFKDAREHFISSILICPEDDEFIGFNNLGYMLRRGEIDSVVINGKSYDVPTILERGVEEGESFCLVNMALYICLKDKEPNLRKGWIYIRGMHGNDIAKVKEFWEKLALKGELEGYIVLEWLYRFEWIVQSVVGSREQVERILESKGIVVV